MPLTNDTKAKALAFAAQQQMLDRKDEQRLMTGPVEDNTVRVVTALLRLTEVLVGMEDR